MRLSLIRSVDQLENQASAWNQLWSASGVLLPTFRAEMLASWLRFFGWQNRWQALVVEDQGQWVAALPLVSTRKSKWIPVASLPANPWSESGGLMVHCQDALPRHLAMLLDGICQLKTPLLWLDWINYQRPEWIQLLDEARNRKLACHVQQQHVVGLMNTQGDWSAYESRLSKNHRKRMRRAERQLMNLGQVEFRSLRGLSPRQIEPLLREGFEVEDRSWKADQGSSVLRSGRLFDFYVEQARLLAEAEMLELLNLRLDGELIASEYGYRWGGTYFSHKVGYDSAYAKHSPGHLLIYHQLQECCRHPDMHWIDSLGIMSQATAKWSTHATVRGRILLSTGKIGNGLIAGYRRAAPWVRRCRGIASYQAPPLGAAAEANVGEAIATTSVLSDAATDGQPAVSPRLNHRDQPC